MTDFELRGALGVYMDRAPFAVPKSGLSDARNCRLKAGHLRAEGMGWRPFFDIVLNGPVTGIHRFRLRDGTKLTVFGTPTDLYRFDTGTSSVRYITPRYETGTASWAGGTIITGAGTTWLTNAAAGDEICLGTAGETDPDAVWYEIDSVTDDTHVVLTTNSVGIGVTQPYTIRRKFQASRLDPWIADVFYNAQPSGDDLWFATNGVDVPVSWDGNATQVTKLPGLGFTCRYLKVFGGMMLYADIVESGTPYPHVVRNSAITEPENVTTLEATQINGTDTADRILATIPLGDVVVVYGESSASLMQFIGPPLFWAVRTLTRNRGALSSRSIVDRGDFHEVLCRDMAVRFDGVRAEEFGDQVFREVLRKLDLNRLAQAIGFADLENVENLWVVPSNDDGDPATASPTTAYTEHYLEKVGPNPTPMMIRDLPATALGEHERSDALRFDEVVGDFIGADWRWNDRFFNAAFPVKLMGMADGAVMELGGSASKDGAPIESYARFRRIAVVDGDRRGMVREIEVIAEERPGATYPLDVNLYGANTAEGANTLRATVEHALDGSGPRWHRPRVLERFLDVELRTDGADEGWAAWGVRLKAREAGRR